MRRTSLTLLSLPPVIAVAVLFAGCASPTGPPGPTGTLTGKLQAIGGPPDDGPRALSGQITLNGSSGHMTAITVGANGRFSVPVTVGTYTVSAHEGGTADCHASGPVVVTKGVTSHVVIDCQEK